MSRADPSDPVGDVGLIARAAELEQLERLVAGARRQGSSLLVVGPPGIGKTTLLDAVAACAPDRGARVLRIHGNPAESRLPLAGLQALLLPLMAAAGALPEAQQAALRGAFGLAAAPPPQLFLIALAALDLLAEVAAQRPLLVLAEDLHWLDRATVEVLAFVARRLDSDPIVLLASSRDATDQPALVDSGLPELRLRPLDATASALLLDRSSPELDPSQRRAVLEAAEGNPLALVELPKGLQRRPPLDGSEQLPLTRTLERAFAARVPELPGATAAALLVAALNDSESVMETLRATARLRGAPVEVGVFEGALAAGLIQVDRDLVRFRHALVRSAVSQAATPDARRAAHTALAAVLEDQPDRRAWHRAAAATGRDEAVAVELESAARRAQQQGALAAAVVALERAGQLSEEEPQRHRRLLRAVELSVELGDPDHVARLLAALSPLALGTVEHLRLERTRELADPALQGGAQRVEELVALAERASGEGEPALALEFLRAAAERCWVVGSGRASEERVVTAVDRLAVDELDPARIATYAYAAPLARSRDVLALLARRPPDPGAEPSTMHHLGRAASCAGAFSLAEAYFLAAERGLRAEGRLTVLASVLALRAWAALRCGRWDVAVLAGEEGARLAQETRQPLWWASALSAQAMVCGLRGDEDAAQRLAGEAEALAIAGRYRIAMATIQLARCTAAAGAGRHEEAFAQLWRIYQPDDLAHQRLQGCWAIGHLADVARGEEHRALARGQLAALEPLTADGRSPGFRVAMLHARALLAEPEDAERRFADALGADLSAWPFEHGRLLLAHGARLRRERRVTESREPLRAARDALDRLGAEPWAARARQELRAAGEASEQRRPEAWDALSPHELRIARLVAQGLSNKEIGQRLYLSHRTIGSHLHRMFPKLGITSRAQMARVLADHEDPSSAA